MPTVISLLVRFAGLAAFICWCTIWAAPMLVVLATPGFAEKGKLRERLTPDVMAVVYPGAERLGPEEGSPPAITVYKDNKAVAYIFSTLDIIAAPGNTSTPDDHKRGRRH
jgi:transcriptional regulator of nitric oxide reductase